MRTNLLYLLLTLIIFSSCSKDEPAPEKKYLLQRKLSEVTYPGGGVTIDLTYSYNDLQEMIRINGVIIRKDELVPVHTDISYDSQGRVIHVENRLGTIWTNEYNQKSQLVKSTRKYKDSDPYIYLHSYNDRDQLVEIKIYQSEVSEGAYKGNTLISYESGNRINIKTIPLATGVAKEYSLITDNQNRELPPLPHQITAEFGAVEIFAEPYITSNNIISFAYLNEATNQYDKYKYQAAYTYNEGGYPETCIKTHTSGAVEKVTYVYTTK